jgi:hypothetical protein
MRPNSHPWNDERRGSSHLIRGDDGSTLTSQLATGELTLSGLEDVRADRRGEPGVPVRTPSRKGVGRPLATDIPKRDAGPGPRGTHVGSGLAPTVGTRAKALVVGCILGTISQKIRSYAAAGREDVLHSLSGLAQDGPFLPTNTRAR